MLVPGLHAGILPGAGLREDDLGPTGGGVRRGRARGNPQTQRGLGRLGVDLPLTILKSPWRSLTQPVLQYCRTLRAEEQVDLVTVIIPELLVARWWQHLLHNQSGLLLKLALMREPNVVVTNVRYRPE